MLVERMEKDEQATTAQELPCKLLVADDQPHILEALRLLLKPEGYQLEMVRTPALVLEAAIDLALLASRRNLRQGQRQMGLSVPRRRQGWTHYRFLLVADTRHKGRETLPRQGA